MAPWPLTASLCIGFQDRISVMMEDLLNIGKIMKNVLSLSFHIFIWGKNIGLTVLSLTFPKDMQLVEGFHSNSEPVPSYIYKRSKDTISTCFNNLKLL